MSPPSTIRTIVSRHRIASTGKRGRAKVYAVRDITRAAGSHDRILAKRAALAQAGLAPD